ncbi:MAG TPA: retropepsin-like aspartic protease [Stellaceae bacterium]|nr:retropepsin-like aspartic protease [Stellaceae bacterium]
MISFVASLGIALLLLLSAAPIRTAAADDQCPDRQPTELALGFSEGVPLVTVRIDRAPARMILDTGAEETVLSTAAAARLGLDAHYEYPRQLRSVSGGVVTGEAKIASLAAGSAGARDFIVLVGSLSLPGAGEDRPDGLLGGDFLSRFDVDLDLSGGRLTLYRPGCAPARPPWRMAYTTVAANRSLYDRLFFPVDLDGRKLFAFFDTGAQISAIDRRAVLGLGLPEGAIARDPVATMRGVSSAMVKVHAHRFRQLRIGDTVLRDPVLIVAGLNLSDADIVLGLDVLRGRRLWLSYAAHRVFLGLPRGP